jgi:hypothetical protein
MRRVKNNYAILPRKRSDDEFDAVQKLKLFPISLHSYIELAFPAGSLFSVVL